MERGQNRGWQHTEEEGSTVKLRHVRADYANLFQDIQLVNANDFLTTPFTSVLDLLTLKIRFLRYVDESNPPYNRVKLACQTADVLLSSHAYYRFNNPLCYSCVSDIHDHEAGQQKDLRRWK